MALGLLAWLLLLLLMSSTLMRNADAGRYALSLHLLSWVLMLTAMMLPSELTYLGALRSVLAVRLDHARDRHAAWLSFVAGYGFAWLGYGMVAYLVDALLQPYSIILWNHAGPELAGAALILAGAYQLSPLKRVCLRHCRSPLAFFARHWRDGRFGALAMGTRHGLVCVGCCWALMALMFIFSAMNLTWMALLTLLMFAEKVLPQGQRLALPTAGALAAMGLWVFVSPATAPLLQAPLVFSGGWCRAY